MQTDTKHRHISHTKPGDKLKIKTAIWLRDNLERLNLSVHDVAKEAGMSPSTLYRLLDEASEFSPTIKTIEKVARTIGVPGPHEMDIAGIPKKYGGLSEELTPMADIPNGEPLAGNNQGAWTINTRALELQGLLPGDVVIIDMAVKPVQGDIVCAKSYNFQTGTADTIIRLFEPPYLSTHTVDMLLHEKPLLLDNDRVTIMGTMVKLIRERRQRN